MKGTTKVPRVASMLGWAGVVPFALLALSVALRQGMAPALALDALFAYAAIILAFMGGVRWAWRWSAHLRTQESIQPRSRSACFQRSRHSGAGSYRGRRVSSA